MAPSKKKDDAAETAETRFAVYDETLLKFVGKVHDDKADAEKAAKSGPSSHTLKVREV